MGWMEIASTTLRSLFLGGSLCSTDRPTEAMDGEGTRAGWNSCQVQWLQLKSEEQSRNRIDGWMARSNEARQCCSGGRSTASFVRVYILGRQTNESCTCSTWARMLTDLPPPCRSFDTRLELVHHAHATRHPAKALCSHRSSQVGRFSPDGTMGPRRSVQR